jgi:hypothetical protein
MTGYCARTTLIATAASLLVTHASFADAPGSVQRRAACGAQLAATVASRQAPGASVGRKIARLAVAAMPAAAQLVLQHPQRLARLRLALEPRH